MAEEKKAAEAVKKFKVKIHSGQDEADKGDVFLAHNYRGILIQRDQEVVIEEHYVNALKASMIHTTLKKDGKEEAITIPRYSYEISPA